VFNSRDENTTRTAPILKINFRSRQPSRRASPELIPVVRLQLPVIAN
jgi:hypothetical protein